MGGKEGKAAESESKWLDQAGDENWVEQDNAVGGATEGDAETTKTTLSGLGNIKKGSEVALEDEEDETVSKEEKEVVNASVKQVVRTVDDDLRTSGEDVEPNSASQGAAWTVLVAT